MSDHIGFRSNLEKEAIDWKAGQLGLNRSEFINLAVEVLVNFDDEMLKKMQRFAENSRFSIPEFINLVVIGRMAQLQGQGMKADLKEFLKPFALNMEQEKFFNHLVEEYEKEAKNE
jgi:acylphosphatase